jgi:hypothetical protein
MEKLAENDLTYFYLRHVVIVVTAVTMISLPPVIYMCEYELRTKCDMYCVRLMLISEFVMFVYFVLNEYVVNIYAINIVFIICLFCIGTVQLFISCGTKHHSLVKKIVSFHKGQTQTPKSCGKII